MRVMRKEQDSSPRKSVYDESMETFYRAADLMGLNPRVRLELEEPDFEHIFYVTIETRDRLVPLDQGGGGALQGPPRLRR